MPVIATVKGHVGARDAAGVEHVRVNGIFADDAHRLFSRPEEISRWCAVVGGPVEIRMAIARGIAHRPPESCATRRAVHAAGGVGIVMRPRLTGIFVTQMRPLDVPAQRTLDRRAKWRRTESIRWRRRQRPAAAPGSVTRGIARLHEQVRTDDVPRRTRSVDESNAARTYNGRRTKCQRRRSAEAFVAFGLVEDDDLAGRARARRST